VDTLSAAGQRSAGGFGTFQRWFCHRSPFVLRVEAGRAVQSLSSLGGVLSAGTALCRGQARALGLCCLAVRLGTVCSALGHENAAPDDPDVRVNSFSFLGSVFLLHLLIFVLLISQFIMFSFPTVFLYHQQASHRGPQLSAFSKGANQPVTSASETLLDCKPLQRCESRSSQLHLSRVRCSAERLLKVKLV